MLVDMKNNGFIYFKQLEDYQAIKKLLEMKKSRFISPKQTTSGFSQIRKNEVR